MIDKVYLQNIIENIRIRTNNVIAIILFHILLVSFGRGKRNSKNLLFINTGLLGDVLISTIIFNNEQELKKNYNKIYFLIDKKLNDLFESYNGDIKILKWQSKNYKYNLLYRLRFLGMIKKCEIGEVINISFTRRILDDELTLLTGAIKKTCFENNPIVLKLFSKYMDSFYDEIIEPVNGNNFYDLNNLLKKLGVSEPKEGTKVYTGHKKIKSIENTFLFSGGKKIISVAPFSSNPIKNWSLDNYFKLFELLITEFDSIILILGEKKDRKFLRSTQNLSNKIINAVGFTNLSQVASMISSSNLFIGNDSGLFHLAKAIKTRRIGVVGGGAYNITLPYGEQENEILIFKELECFGCRWKCKYDNAHCLNEVTVNKVFEVAKNMLTNA